MPRRPPAIGNLPDELPPITPDLAPAADDIPELDDVVDLPSAVSAPPPNLDLFADSGLDAAALRAALAGRLADEIDAALTDLRAEFEETLRHRMEALLRDRLPEIIDGILTGAANPPE